MLNHSIRENDVLDFGIDDPDAVDRTLKRCLMNVFNAQRQSVHSMAHTRGQIVCSNKYIITVEKILLDTGSLHSNFISKDLFESFAIHVGEDQIERKKMVIGFADKTSRMECDTSVNLILRFMQEEKNKTILYEGSFIVADMGNNDIIIGLPAIMGELWGYFFDILKERRSPDSNKSDLNYLNIAELIEVNAVEELLKPWAKDDLEVAPEDDLVPDPVQFEFASSFLGKSRKEALKEFEDMFDEHISPEFRAAQPVVQLLLSKGVKVFIPEKWEGIKGVEPFKINFKDTLPDRLKPKARPVNPRLYEDAEKEFKRLCGYFYEPSRSPWASCLVIAPKATKPFIRFCGDYITINKYTPSPHYTVPNVKHELDKIIGYKIFLDIDLTNAFHQIALHPETAEKLSVQTPWGQFQPKFLPEGVSPGISILQETVVKLFSDFEWAICIFDNILLLAYDFEDAYQKFDMFLDRCIKHEVVLKFSKTWLGFAEVKFFGYLCRHNSISLTDDRQKAILEIPFPEGGNRTKKVRMILGMGVFFAPFVPNYADLIKHITDMTKSTFNWDESTWTIDYRGEYDRFKAGLQKSCTIFYPDYNLEWVLRTDASDYGVSGILTQVSPATDEKPKEHQTIAICSKKLSPQAFRWKTIEKEGFGIFYSVKKFSYYLRGKFFIIETDHNNLVWMEASEVAKIVRWRIYLQDFHFLIRHIPGKLNVVADCLSRLLFLQGYHLPEDEDFQLCNVFDNEYEEIWPTKKEYEEVGADDAQEKALVFDKVLESVHNDQVGHWGARETWRRLNKEYPGHGVSYQTITDFVAECANCQKTRREIKQRLVPVTRHLKPPHSRSAIGIDAVQITPTGKKGETHIIVIVNLFTKLVFLYPVVGVTAINLSVAVWTFWCNFGHTDLIISDMGPDLKSQLFAELVKLMGMRHIFSIANRHINGCERIIKEIGRHLRAMVYDKRISDVFGDPTMIPSVQYIINTHISDETAQTPFELTFGTQDVIYRELLVDAQATDPSHMLLKRLNDNLVLLRQVSKEYQTKLIQERASKGITPSTQNSYQKGDFVMFDSGPKPHPKMSCRMKGPFEVVRQYKNDVLVRNLVTGGMKEYSVSDLEPFFGTKEAAEEAALRDQEQFRVSEILSYTGDSRLRTQMTFKVKYADGDILDIPWSPDIQCEAYYEFCSARPHLFHLTLDATLAKRFISQKKREDITSVTVGDQVFVDLRFFGDIWYEQLNLPDFASSRYVMSFTYTHWYHRTSKKKISARFDLNGQSYAFDNYLVFAWGSCKVFDPGIMILVDEALSAKFPKIVEAYTTITERGGEKAM